MKVGELKEKLSYFSDDDDICFVDYNDDRVLTFQADVSWIHDGVYKSKTGEIYLSAIPLSDSEFLGEFNVIYLRDIVYPLEK